jgi:hypothetical protein
MIALGDDPTSSVQNFHERFERARFFIDVSRVTGSSLLTGSISEMKAEAGIPSSGYQFRRERNRLGLARFLRIGINPGAVFRLRLDSAGVTASSGLPRRNRFRGNHQNRTGTGTLFPLVRNHQANAIAARLKTFGANLEARACCLLITRAGPYLAYAVARG